MRTDPLTALIYRHAGRHGPIMLMYHAVSPGMSRPPWPWAVSMQQFRDQLDFLAAEGYATPTVGELVAAPAPGRAGRTAVITFDDGYADNLTACEELQKRGMRASWFIVSGSIGLAPLWPENDRPAGRLLNAVELREMHAGGMEIGSHTVSHVRLNEIDDARLMQELIDSKATLEDLLGYPVNSFAYPYGAFDTRCVEAVMQAGYTAACTTRSGWAQRDGDPYQLRRLTLSNTDTLSRFARKLSFGSNDASWSAVARYGIQRIRNHVTP